jgi:hypothetical protein
MPHEYNYKDFIPTEIEPHLCFDRSPVLGEPAPDFPLWDLDQNKTSLNAIWSQFDFTIVEFGSFT